MEQDSPGGDFELSEVLSGTLYDVRLWNTVRAEHEIAASHNQRFDTARLPDELIANWQMDRLSGDSKVVDVVSGNQLAIRHTTATGFTASTPVTGLTVTEGAANGTVLGSLMVSTTAPAENLVRDPHFAYSGTSLNPLYNNGEVIGDAGLWLVDSGNVELVTDFQTTPIGGYGIDLDGLTPGSISQTLSTEVGRTYQINFTFSGNFDANGDKTVRVSTGATSSDFSLSMPSGWTKDNLLWQQRSMRFVANSTDTTLSFSSQSASGSHGPIIGDVSVVELSDSIAILLSANPDLNYDPHTGKFYQLISTPGNWATAHASALATQLNGVAGQLVTIGSEYENTLARSLAGNNIHLGLSDQTTEGEWYWQSGSSDAELMWSGGNSGSAQNGFYNNWSGSEPNNHNDNEDHAVMFYVSGLWNDAKPSENYLTLIEWDAADVLQASEFTYNIQTDTTSAYTIDTNTGALSVANGSAIDFESAAANDITVRVTGSNGEYHDETLTIAVLDRPAPVIAAIEPATLTYTENDLPVPVSTTLTVVDPDNATLESATVAVRSGFYYPGDLLQFADYGPFTSNWNAANGVLTINGPATTAEWEAALRTVTYMNSTDDPMPGPVFFDFTAYDGFEHSTVAYRRGDVVAVNDAPALDDGVFPGIPEDSTDPAGQTITDIFSGQYSDADGDLTQLRFVPAADYFGVAPTLTAIGIDDSYTGGWSVTSAVVTDLTVRGGSTPFAQDASVIQPNVTPVGPTGLATGVTLNTNGGNDAYLFANDGGALLGGLQAITIETQFAVDTTLTFTPLLSYATPAYSNDLLLAIENDGTIFFHINDQRTDVPVDYPILLDGNRHSLAVSWDSLHGDVAFYIDGNLIHTSTGLQAGYIINAAGSLVFGQDQDSVNGEYDPDQQLQGTLFDLRIWSEARTAAEVAQTHQHRLHADTLPTGLIANWQMDGFDSTGQIVDVVGGNNLSVVHIAGAPFTAGTATAVLSVPEDAGDGTVVGYLAPQSSTQVEDLVQDGRFTSAGATAAQNYTAGQTIGGGDGFWTVAGGDVDVQGDWDGTSPLGGPAVDLDGALPGGSISQTIPTEAGNVYQLQFAFSGNFGDSTSKSMTVSAGGENATFTIDPPEGWAKDSLLWNQRSMTFTATSDSTLLIFASNSTAGDRGPVIGDVRVVELSDAVSSILAANTRGPRRCHRK